MLKIGEFSKLAHITVKALRFYDEEGILMPASIDEWTGYRYYETDQLLDAARIKALRQLGLSVKEIRGLMETEHKQTSPDLLGSLEEKRRELLEARRQLDTKLSIINHILEDKEMKYQVTEKVAPAAIVYYSEKVVADYMDLISWVPSLGEECLGLNPGLKCADPAYEFCEYLDGEYKPKNMRVRHNEAVSAMGKEGGNIRFKQIPETKVLSTYHHGSYATIGEAYAFIAKYAEENGYKAKGLARECYIDGIWNKESEDDWLTEIQLPIV